MPLVLITVESVINEAPPIVPAEMIGDVIDLLVKVAAPASVTIVPLIG